MKIIRKGAGRFNTGITLVEVTISIALIALTIGGVIRGYLLVMERAQWTAYSLAAQAQAMRMMEQSHAAQWNALANPPIDYLVGGNIPMTIDVLDTPLLGTNAAYVTNVVLITSISNNPSLKLVRVQSSWAFLGKSYTNTLVTYRAPN